MKFPVRKLDARFHGDGWRQQSPEERQNDMFLVHLSRKMRTASKNPSATADMRHFPQSAICKVWAGLFNHGSLCLFGTFGDPHLHQGGFHLLEHHREMRSFLHWGSFFQIDSAMICLYNIYNIYTYPIFPLDLGIFVIVAIDPVIYPFTHTFLTYRLMGSLIHWLTFEF